MSHQLNISVVLYKPELERLTDFLNSLLRQKISKKIYLIDNSPEPIHKFERLLNKDIEYIFNNENLGYGSGHNIAIRKSITDNIKYHLVLNPDVFFLQQNSLQQIFSFMEVNEGIGSIMPKIIYENGELQRLCKLLPSPYDLIMRRFTGNTLGQKRNAIFELQDFEYDQIINVPNLSGCFMFMRTSALEKITGFDPRFFMYLEDIDLIRRLHKTSKTLFYPEVTVIHGYQKGSYKNIRLLFYHIRSAIKYFNKWGWFFDKERRVFNNTLLAELKTIKKQR